MSEPMLSTRPGSDANPSTTALNMFLAPSAPLLAICPAQEPRFEITLPKKSAMRPGSCEMKLIALLTNCEPALAACAAMSETHPVTVAMTLFSQSANICGSWLMVVPRFEKKSPIA